MASRKSITRRDEIVETAAVIFEARGYYNASMDDIAEAMGIRKPTLYHYVESKGQIVAWIHDRLCDGFIDRINQRIEQGMKPTECLVTVMTDIFETLDSSPGHLRVYFEHHREIPEKCQATSRAKRDEYFATVRDLIIAGEEAGEFKVENAEMATFALFGMCNWAYQWYRPKGQLSPQEISQMFWRIFASGIKVDAGRTDALRAG